MTFVGIKKPADRTNVIFYLRSLSATPALSNEALRKKRRQPKATSGSLPLGNIARALGTCRDHRRCLRRVAAHGPLQGSAHSGAPGAYPFHHPLEVPR